MKREWKEALDALYDKFGTITPEMIKEAAKSKKHPLYEAIYLDCDVEQAADNWYTEKARRLLRSYEVKIKVENRTVMVPYYVRNPDAEAKEQGYSRVTDIKSDEDRAREVIVAEFQRVRWHLDRARRLSAVLGIEEQLDSMQDILLSIEENLDIHIMQ